MLHVHNWSRVLDHCTAYDGDSSGCCVLAGGTLLDIDSVDYVGYGNFRMDTSLTDDGSLHETCVHQNIDHLAY